MCNGAERGAVKEDSAMEIIDEDHLRWTDPNSRVWDVTLVYLNGQAMAVPFDWTGKSTRGPEQVHVKFTNPSDAAMHGEVPYSSEKPLSELSEEEVERYWKRANLP
jgi:hypothetical protein